MRSKDRNQFFYFPVDVNEVPTYRDIIKNPMSFDLMEARASKKAYKTLDDVQKDFKLICENAMKFNPEGSIWYRAAEVGWLVSGEFWYGDVFRNCKVMGRSNSIWPNCMV